jgi:hypothetical protein
MGFSEFTLWRGTEASPTRPDAPGCPVPVDSAPASLCRLTLSFSKERTVTGPVEGLMDTRSAIVLETLTIISVIAVLLYVVWGPT